MTPYISKKECKEVCERCKTDWNDLGCPCPCHSLPQEDKKCTYEYEFNADPNDTLCGKKMPCSLHSSLPTEDTKCKKSVIIGTTPNGLLPHWGACDKINCEEHTPPTESIREELAELEHEQWIKWSKSIAENEDISFERFARWQKLWCSYSQLTEEEKDQDREWADKVLSIVASEIAKARKEAKEDCDTHVEMEVREERERIAKEIEKERDLNYFKDGIYAFNACIGIALKDRE